MNFPEGFGFEKIAANILLPRHCIGCRSPLKPLPDPPPICRECELGFFDLSSPRCPSCDHPHSRTIGPEAPGEPEKQCGECLRNPPDFDAIDCRWEYFDLAREVLLDIKESEMLWKTRGLGELLSDWLLEKLSRANYDPGFDRIVPVPMHPRRLRTRGFNQALEILEWALQPSDISPTTKLIRKTEHTEKQFSLAPSRRRENISGAFCAADLSDIRRVFVFDDIVTTTSTADEIAGTLKSSGAESVRVLAATRTLRTRSEGESGRAEPGRPLDSFEAGPNFG